jgi:hypothetical protein
MKKLFEKRGNVTIMDRVEPHDFDGVCEDCGKTDELRPYGPNNANVCFDCMMKDEPGARKRMEELRDKGSQ